jgi:ammonia channel protein AmtB
MEPAMFAVNNLWIRIAAALVFIMHLGFATLESGQTQKKNCVNILFKNVWIITTGLLLYAFWGFNSMYPGDGGNGFFNPDHSIGTQILGTVAIGAFAFVFAFVVFFVLKLTMGVRVSEEMEVEGLDVPEHGVPAYADLA